MMTTQVARIVQACFTRGMSTVTRKRETIYDKAKRIADDPARTLISEHAQPPHWWTGRVVGDHGTYSAFAISPEMKEEIHLGGEHRVGCFCPAGRNGKLCSHAIVAEEMRRRGEDT